jgi:hypothetical protein
MKLWNYKITDVANAPILLAFDIGAGAQYELELSDIFAISTKSFLDTAIDTIFTHLSNGMYKIGRGWKPSRSSYFA